MKNLGKSGMISQVHTRRCKLLQQQSYGKICSSRYQQSVFGQWSFRRKCRRILRVGWFPSFWPAYGGRHRIWWRQQLSAQNSFHCCAFSPLLLQLRHSICTSISWCREWVEIFSIAGFAPTPFSTPRNNVLHIPGTVFTGDTDLLGSLRHFGWRLLLLTIVNKLCRGLENGLCINFRIPVRFVLGSRIWNKY